MVPRLAICVTLLVFGLTATAATGSHGTDSAPCTCPDADANPAQVTLAHQRSAIVCLLNVERAEQGIAPLATSHRLQRSARFHSLEMVRHSHFGHKRPGGPGLVSRIRRSGYLRGAKSWAVGENIAWGVAAAGTPRALVQAWMQSGGHSENVLNRAFRHVGVGLSRGAPTSALRDEHRPYAVVVTADFGART
jgi:uncharacterized protein YkwD